MIDNDDETKKIQVALSSGMTQNGNLLQQYLLTWDKYREIWELDKEAFIRRYQRLNPPVSSFDADIARYANITFLFISASMIIDMYNHVYIFCQCLLKIL